MNNIDAAFSRRGLLFQLSFGFVGLIAAVGLHAQDANVLRVQGTVQVSSLNDASWQAVSANQSLAAGNIVRTLQDGQIALVLRDQTQLRISQNTVIRIQSLQAGNDQATVLALDQGRIWAQVKQTTAGFLRDVSTKTQAQRLRITTPTATIGIRGTNWELLVGDAGTTRLTVIDGEVEMSNAQGSVSVTANEQAIAELGKAPIKSILTNARDRVQWVTAYRPQPKRWLSEPAPEFKAVVATIESGQFTEAQRQLKSMTPSVQSALLSADLALYAGDTDAVITALIPYSKGSNTNPLAVALHTRALLAAGRVDAALSLLQNTAQQIAEHPELELAKAEALRLSGRSDEALRVLDKLTRSQPQLHETWFTLGRILLDKDDIEAARSALVKAIVLAPNEPSYIAEYATLLVQTSELEAAQLNFDSTLKLSSDDYTAWTGQGILQLKKGQPQLALESFTKAGVLEPRFSRALLYTGIASYQLGDTSRAVQAIRDAADLDTRDPLPYLILGLIYGDARDATQATIAAQQAQVRMPNLKSANAILNDQKGSANLGSALANRGFEEWAQSYAAKSYSPFWAGSAFFSADRYADGFNKNSELLRGYLLDPLSFGASNRFSSLINVPGHYGSVGWEAQRADTNFAGLSGGVNGLLASDAPVAYSINAASGRVTRDDKGFQNGRVGLYNAGLGAKPRHDIGLFYFRSQIAFNTDIHLNAKPSEATFVDGRLRISELRNDIGLSYKPTPSHLILLKLGTGEQTTAAVGGKSDPLFSDFLNQLLSPLPSLLPISSVNFAEERRGRRERDVQISHSFAPSSTLRLSWGFERSSERQSLGIQTSYQSVPLPDFSIALQQQGQRVLSSTQIFLSSRGKHNDAFEWQADVMHQKLRDRTTLATLAGTPSPSNPADITSTTPIAVSEFNPRLGFLFSTSPDQQLRVVYQKWRRPNGATSLAPSDTLNVAVDDRLVNSGGLQNKLRVQYDWQQSAKSFVQIYAQRRSVRNLLSPFSSISSSLDLVDLNTIRPRQQLTGQNFRELEETPSFEAGRVNNAGLAGNFIVAPSISLTTRYVHASSSNTGSTAPGLKLPYIPRHLFNTVAFWQASPQWLVSGSATFRSSRFTDELNLSRLHAGWNMGLTAYWESMDKRWGLQTSINNIRTKKQAKVDSRASLEFSGVYRF